MLKKTHLEVFHLIKKIERTELTHLRSCGIYLSPLLRYHIVSAQWNEEVSDNRLHGQELMDKKGESFSLSFLKIIKFKFLFFIELIKLKLSFKKIKTPHLFFYRREERMADKEGFLVSNIGQGMKLLFNDVDAPFDSINLDELGISKALSFEFYLSREKIYRQILADKTYETLMSITSNFEKENLRIDFQWILDDLTTILAYKKIFTSILNPMTVKNIFYTVFYHPRSLGLALAAHELGIFSTEIQHGLDGEVNALEMEYNFIPQKGYEMLPDAFWQWGEISRTRKKCFSKFSKVLNLGHPGNYYQSKKAAHLDNFSRDKTHILYGIQPVKDPVPEFILAAIKDPSLAHCYWHFRLHPRMLNELPEYIEKYGPIKNVSIKEATNAFIGDLLFSCDVIVSKTSTVLLEGLSFNKLAIAIHPNALDMYRSGIEEKKIMYASSLAELQPLLTGDHELVDNSQYINQDYSEIKKQIQKVYLCAE